MPEKQSFPFHGDRVNEVIVEYLEAAKRGETLDQERFLAKHADIADELKSFFANPSQFNQAAGNQLDGSTTQTQSWDHSSQVPDCDPNEPTVTFVQSEVFATRKMARQFGDYELIQEIARGGMGVVYKARQLALNRTVAVKMILSGQFAGPEDVQRFHIEARAAAQLDHPGIVPIYDVGQHDGQHYFSMGFVEGQSLARRVAKGPLEPNTAADIVKTVADAVHYAHEKGVIHRDLKPGNILLDQDGHPRVTDFGLAKLTEGDSDLTGTGQILGTPSYMPPEQAAAKEGEVGFLSDVYSLGAVLYCLLTGRPPFQAANALETLLQVQKQEPVAPRQLNLNIPLDLDTIVLKCLDKVPSRRYASAKALAEELQRYLEGRPILARRVGQIERFSRWCKREPVVARLGAGVICSLIAGIMVSAYFAIEERKRANSESELAIKNGTLAIEKGELADEKGKLADENGKLAESNAKLAADEHSARLATELQLQIATAERLAAMSHAKRLESPELSLLLAVESGRATRNGNRPPLPSSHQALLDALTAIGGRPLVGHQKHIGCVAISADGHWIVTGSDDTTARVWDLMAKNPYANPHVLSGHQGRITSVAISADSRWVVTGSDDKTARVWDLSSRNPGANPRVLSGHQDGISNVAISADSRWVVTGSGGSLIAASETIDKTARVWDLTSENPSANPHILNEHQSVIRSVAISGDNRWVVTGSEDSTARVWSLTSGNPASNPRVLSGHHESIDGVAISADSRWVVTGSADNTARVWDLTSENPSASPRVLSGHQSAVWCVAISADNCRVVTGSADNTARVWDLTSENPSSNPRVLIGHQDYVTTVAISADNHWVITGGLEKTARVWDITSGNPSANPRLLSGHQNRISAVVISPDSRRVVTGSADSTARIWDLTSENQSANPRILMGRQNGISSVAISVDDRWMVTGGADKTVRVWDLSPENSTAKSRVLGGHHHQIWSVAISANNRWVVSGSIDKTARVWDLTSETPSAEPRVLNGHDAEINSVAISADSRWIVTGSSDKTARIWDLASEIPAANPRVLSGHQNAITGVAISADGRWIVTGSMDNTARVWDLMSENPAANPRVLSGHQSGLYRVAISADSRWIVTGSEDKTARVWDLKSVNPSANPFVLSGQQGGITTVAISPDSRLIVTGSWDRTAWVWDHASAKPSANPRVLSGHQSGITSAVVSADSRSIITGSWDDTVRIWRLPWDDLVSLASEVGRNFDRKDWDAYFPGEPYSKTFPNLPVPGDHSN